MSIYVLAWAWTQKVGDPTTKLVLLKLADQANDEWECWPSRRTIATDCEITRSTVSRHTKTLTDLGLLAILERQRDNQSQTSNLYQLNPLRTDANPPTHGRVPPLVTGDTPPYAPVRTPEPLSEPLDEPLGASKIDAVWEALVELFGEPSNKNTRGKRNRAVKLLKESLTGYVGGSGIAEIHRRAARWPDIFPGASFTDIGFANQWDALVPGTVPSETNQDAIRAMQVREREEREAREALTLPPAESKKRLRELMESMETIGKEIE